MQEQNTESINFLQMRKDKGLTLAQAAELSGYSAPTINGLEIRNEGSKRLRQRLLQVYSESTINDNSESISKQAAPAVPVMQLPPELTLEQWRERALLSEARLQHLKETCDTIGKHAQMLADTVQSLSRMISE